MKDERDPGGQKKRENSPGRMKEDVRIARDPGARLLRRIAAGTGVSRTRDSQDETSSRDSDPTAHQRRQWPS
jgi:hypothetical protein